MYKYNIILLAPLAFSAMAEVDIARETCPTSFSETQCSLISEKVEKIFEEGNPQSQDEVKSAVNEAFDELINDSRLYQSFLDTPSVRSKLDSIPLSLKFKMIDRENEDSVIGLEFAYSHSFNKRSLDREGGRESSFGFDFNVNGTVTHKAEENPRDFLVAKISARYSNDPVFAISPAARSSEPLLTEATKKYCLDDENGNADSDLCDDFDEKTYSKLFAAPGGISFFDFGLDIGYETDQSFDANNRTIGGFAYYSYENHSPNSFFGAFKIKPALLVSIESISPSNETPRAMAGDDSSYERISYEFSLNMPLDELLNIPYTFTYNFRGYEEASPSDVVKAANLDKYRLRTYSLITPIGLVASYSSGRLPFGLEDESIVSLGFQTYF
jgi:hypothetical protein